MHLSDYIPCKRPNPNSTNKLALSCYGICVKKIKSHGSTTVMDEFNKLIGLIKNIKKKNNKQTNT
jgi:hypothetical protein